MHAWRYTCDLFTYQKQLNSDFCPEKVALCLYLVYICNEQNYLVMKNLWVLLLGLLFFPAFSLLAQIEDEAPVESMKVEEQEDESSEQLRYTKSLGLKSGYYTTIGLSYNQFFTNRSAFNVDLGYRIPGGWLGNGENTRIGAILSYEYHYPLNSNPDQLWTAFGTAGLHIAQADYSERGGFRDYGETFMTSGVTFGLGLSVRWGRVNVSGALMPAYDFLNPEYGGGDFYIWRCSRVAVRYMF